MAENELITLDQQQPRELFMVAASGHRSLLPIPSPQSAHETAAALRSRFPNRQISWMLRPDSPAPAEFCGRYRRIEGLSESRRVGHLFLLPPGKWVSEATVLSTLCGEPIRADLLEILPGRVGGMPCYRCLALIPTPDAPAAEITRQANGEPPHRPRSELGTSALTELDQRHIDPGWPAVDDDPGLDTPIARAVWADLNHGRLATSAARPQPARPEKGQTRP
jgi:hypothetical protein